MSETGESSGIFKCVKIVTEHNSSRRNEDLSDDKQKDLSTNKPEHLINRWKDSLVVSYQERSPQYTEETESSSSYCTDDDVCYSESEDERTSVDVSNSPNQDNNWIVTPSGQHYNDQDIDTSNIEIFRVGTTTSPQETIYQTTKVGFPHVEPIISQTKPVIKTTHVKWDINTRNPLGQDDHAVSGATNKGASSDQRNIKMSSSLGNPKCKRDLFLCCSRQTSQELQNRQVFTQEYLMGEMAVDAHDPLSISKFDNLATSSIYKYKEEGSSKKLRLEDDTDEKRKNGLTNLKDKETTRTINIYKRGYKKYLLTRYLTEQKLLQNESMLELQEKDNTSESNGCSSNVFLHPIEKKRISSSCYDSIYFNNTTLVKDREDIAGNSRINQENHDQYFNEKLIEENSLQSDLEETQSDISEQNFTSNLRLLKIKHKIGKALDTCETVEDNDFPEASETRDAMELFGISEFIKVASETFPDISCHDVFDIFSECDSPDNVDDLSQSFIIDLLNDGYESRKEN